MAWGDELLDTTQDLVTTRFANAEGYAQGAYNTAVAYLLSIQNALAEMSITTPSVSVVEPEEPAWGDLADLAPTSPSIDMTMPAVPEEPDFEDIEIDTIAVPELTAAEPSIDLPSRPDSTVPDAPSDVPAISSPTMPDAPEITIPEVPELQAVSIPEIPYPSMPSFSATAPSVDLVAPSVVIDTSNTAYASTLKDAIAAKLLADVQSGDVGVSADVETAIFNREVERAQQAHQDAIDEMMAVWSKRGLELPDGALAAQVTAMEADYRNKRLDVARDVAIKSFELAQQNTQWSVQAGVGWETQLMNYYNTVAERTFQASKALMDANIAVYNAQVARYNALLEAYKTEAAVYETRIRSEVAKLEAYKVQLEAAKTISEVNRNNVEIYRARLAGLSTLVENYRAQIEAAKSIMQIEALRVDAFKARVDAYQATVNAKTATYNMFTAATEGEKAKVSIYAAQVDAYKARMEGAKVSAQLRLEEARVRVEKNKDLSARYAATMDGYKILATSEIERIKAIIARYEAETKGYGVSVQAYAAEAQADMDLYKGRLQMAIENANAELKVAELSVKSYDSLNALRIEALKTGATVASHLAAGAMSGISAQASIDARYSGQQSYTHSDNYNY